MFVFFYCSFQGFNRFSQIKSFHGNATQRENRPGEEKRAQSVSNNDGDVCSDNVVLQMDVLILLFGFSIICLKLSKSENLAVTV